MSSMLRPPSAKAPSLKPTTLKESVSATKQKLKSIPKGDAPSKKPTASKPTATRPSKPSKPKASKPVPKPKPTSTAITGTTTEKPDKMEVQSSENMTKTIVPKQEDKYMEIVSVDNQASNTTNEVRVEDVTDSLTREELARLNSVEIVSITTTRVGKNPVDPNKSALKVAMNNNSMSYTSPKFFQTPDGNILVPSYRINLKDAQTKGPQLALIDQDPDTATNTTNAVSTIVRRDLKDLQVVPYEGKAIVPFNTALEVQTVRQGDDIAITPPMLIKAPTAESSPEEREKYLQLIESPGREMISVAETTQALFPNETPVKDLATIQNYYNAFVNNQVFPSFTDYMNQFGASILTELQQRLTAADEQNKQMIVSAGNQIVQYIQDNNQVLSRELVARQTEFESTFGQALTGVAQIAFQTNNAITDVNNNQNYLLNVANFLDNRITQGQTVQVEDITEVKNAVGTLQTKTNELMLRMEQNHKDQLTQVIQQFDQQVKGLKALIPPERASSQQIQSMIQTALAPLLQQTGAVDTLQKSVQQVIDAPAPLSKDDVSLMVERMVRERMASLNPPQPPPVLPTTQRPAQVATKRFRPRVLFKRSIAPSRRPVIRSSEPRASLLTSAVPKAPPPSLDDNNQPKKPSKRKSPSDPQNAGKLPVKGGLPDEKDMIACLSKGKELAAVLVEIVKISSTGRTPKNALMEEVFKRAKALREVIPKGEQPWLLSKCGQPDDDGMASASIEKPSNSKTTSTNDPEVIISQILGKVVKESGTYEDMKERDAKKIREALGRCNGNRYNVKVSCSSLRPPKSVLLKLPKKK